MKKTILEIYALAVCFFTVACFVITLGIALYDVIKVAAPEFTLKAYQYDQHQSNDAFKRHIPEKERDSISDEELTKRREESYAQTIRSEQHQGKQSLVQMGIIMFIDIIVFMFHWVLAKRARGAPVA